jgi:hypothetical protein
MATTARPTGRDGEDDFAIPATTVVLVDGLGVVFVAADELAAAADEDAARDAPDNADEDAARP